MSELRLVAALRRGLSRLSASAAIILARGLTISRGGQLYAGTGEMADWLGDSDRRNSQRIRTGLIDRGLLIVVEQRRRENGADSVLVCDFSDAVLAIYRSWREARPAATKRRQPTTKCHRQLVPSSGFQRKPSEGAREGALGSLSEEKIPDWWMEAAENERRLAGLPAADLRLEWRKLVNRAEGQPITRWRWIDWALKARCSRPRTTVSGGEPCPISDAASQHEARARHWAKSGFWLPSFGPRPDEPGCYLPPASIAWARAERVRNLAPAPFRSG